MPSCTKCNATLEQNSQFCGNCGTACVSGGGVKAAPSGSRTWTVGGDPSCDVVLAHPSVSRKHLEVTSLDQGRLQIRDLGSANGTYVNAKRVQTTVVRPNDAVQLGMLPVAVRNLLPDTPTFVSDRQRVLKVGRTEDNDLVVSLPVVSATHAEVRVSAQGLEIRDLSSANGTWVNGQKVGDWILVPRQSTLHLGNYRIPDRQREQWMNALQASSTTGADGAIKVTLGERLTIGRDPDCDVVIDHPTVSWHHARLETKQGRTTLRDLSSSNGTFVNGSRIQRSNVTPEDQITIGRVPLSIGEGKVVAPLEYHGEIRLDVEAVCRDIPAIGLRILDSVSLSVFPGEIVALMGASGAGKTTLLEVLTGEKAPSSGRVFVNGVSLHANRESFVDAMGYVPQEDVMNRDLTVFEVLYYAARLRLPGDMPDSAIRVEVENLITKMGLSHIRNSIIGGEEVRGISGGQRKRVNIALELLHKPSLLFLDEPTSGLDATSTLEVIQVLRDLANEGTTIIMTVHQPRIEAFRLVDNLLLLAKGGRLAYYGPAMPDAGQYFEQLSALPRDPGGNPADYVIDVLAASADATGNSQVRDPKQWQSEYRSSRYQKLFVTDRRQQDAQVVLTKRRRGQRVGRSVLSQLGTLTKRYALKKTRDSTALVVQGLQPLVVALLLWFIFEDLEWPKQAPVELQSVNSVHVILFLVAATVFWLGCSNSARELVAERPIFRRESMAGLSTSAYLLANVVVQTGIGAMQVGLLAGITWVSLGSLAAFGTAFVILMLTLLAGVGTGLAISAWSKTEVAAISWLPLVLLPQLMLAGYLKFYGLLSEGLQALSGLMPIRWSFEGLLHSEYGSRTIAEDQSDRWRKTCSAHQMDASDLPEGLPLPEDVLPANCDEYDLLYTLQETLGFDGEVGPSIMILVLICGTTLGMTYTRLLATKP